MVHQNNEQTRVIQFVKENWVFLVFTVSIITTWTNFLNNDKQSEARLSVLESKISKSEEAQNAILTKLSSIETDIQWVKLNLSELHSIK